MSASDSGLVVVALPVVAVIGAVSLTAAGVTKAAEKYRRFRFDKATVEQLESKARLDFLNSLADANRKEYQALLSARAEEEASRRSQEERRFALQSQLRESRSGRLQTEAEIRLLIGRMEQAVREYEAEFGEEQRLRDMAETIRYSQNMFGNGVELLQELNDLLFVVIPCMAEEKREQRAAARLEEHYNGIVSEHFRVVDTSKEFVSLRVGETTDSGATRKTPWEQFVAQVQAVAKLEALHYETDASKLLEEAENVAPSRRNYYIQQNQLRLLELEERAEEYRKQQEQLSEKTVEDYCSYLAITRKLGLQARYSRSNLSDPCLLSEMRRETETLLEQYRKQMERQYTAHAFSVVMKRHKLSFENMDLDGHGRLHLEYAMDQHSGIRISRSESGAFEMQFQGKSRGANASLDEQRSFVEKATHFCTLLPSISRELEEEFGITFEQTALQPPSLEHIEITQSKTSSRPEVARTIKAMQMKL